ncbi:MAG TPA: dTDP-4-dehydrorhamnose 3,5-epimerase [Ferrovibrio sp.]|uniref:dTDP-4-dehydrorhamnose 3,5-epimerase n=1 Tax=Ferrovibrio sp. TaxID=1917215 RepID=UPI002ED1097D
MKFREVGLSGAFLIDIERRSDERGFFARTWCRREFAALGIDIDWLQASVSVSRRRGTLRGMHYQAAPHGEAKLIRCSRGAIYDVIVDLRSESPTYRQWAGIPMSADSYRMLYVPKGFAHGFQTMTDDAEVTYLISEYYVAEAGRGLRHDDPALGIAWPLPVSSISDRDASWPLLAQADAAA